MKNPMKSILWIMLILIFSGLSAYAQRGDTVPARGVVVDEAGIPVIGASVIEEGTGNGVITGADGTFQLNVKRNSNIEISCLGYVTVSVKPGPELKIVLEEDSQMIEETVVVGYGVQRKSSLTGAISSVKSEDMENRTVTNVQSILEGKTAGVQIVTTNGDPGATPSIRIRGISSNASTEPLYVVDGVRMTDISSIETNDIESMEVLKDAASAAIYGAEAGNGVVLITTKKGKQGKGSVSYDFQYTIQNLGNMPRLLNAQEFADASLSLGLITETVLYASWDGKTDTNWIKEVFDTGYMQKHTIGFQGGSDKNQYYMALGYMDNDGIIIGDKDHHKRLTLAVNAEQKVKDWLTVGTTNNIAYSTVSSVLSKSSSTLIDMILKMDPVMPTVLAPDNLDPLLQSALKNGSPLARDKDGNYYTLSLKTKNWNPLMCLDARNDMTHSFQMNGSVYGNLTPLPGLVITSRFGYNLSSSRNYLYVTPYYYSRNGTQKYISYNAGEKQSTYYQWENFANYSHTWNNAHTLTAMAGMSFDQKITDYVTATLTPNGEDAVTGTEEQYFYLNYASGSSIKGVSGETLKTAKFSYFGRLGYDYRNKYIFQATFRADAADLSYLPLNTRWGYFPSVSGAWTVSEEPFFAPLKNAVNFLKVRANWGRNGSLACLGDFIYSNSISNYYAYTLDGSSPLSYTVGTVPTSLGNNNIKWETSEQLDLGLDARFFNDKLTFGVDYYRKMTNGLIITGTTPSLSIGGTASPINAGNVRNSGVEFELSWKHHIGELNYSISGNLATIKNKVTYVDPSLERIDGLSSGSSVYTAFEKGYPIYYFRGYVVTGIDQSNGQPIFEDIDQNGTIDSGDMTYVGSPFPDFTYGITLTAKYKGFDAVLFGTGSQGNDIYFQVTSPHHYGNKIYSVDYEGRWREGMTNATKPGVMSESIGNMYVYSNARVFDGSWFRIKQIQLGYSLPAKLINRTPLTKVRFYASLDDYFLFTKYPGFSPDVASDAITGMGVDQGTTPTSKKAVFGLNITF